MGLALNRLGKEDPSFRYNRDEETGQTTIEGMGELHLEIIVDRMKVRVSYSNLHPFWSLIFLLLSASSRWSAMLVSPR